MPLLPQRQFLSEHGEPDSVVRVQKHTFVANSALESEKDIRGSASIGVPTAVARSVLVSALQFWYRVPIKLFRPMRVDYLTMARAAAQGSIPLPTTYQGKNDLTVLSKRSQFFRATSVGMMAHAIRTQGFSFFHRQVLPPLIMNSFIGSVLYTTYIFTLPVFHPAFSYQKSRTFPPPPFTAVFFAGALAGAAQSLIATPMDSLKIRFQVQDLAHGGKHKSMTAFAMTTLKELGWKSVYRGFGLTIVKDSLACGFFFGVFEWVKQQGYYYFVDELYGIREDMAMLIAALDLEDFDDDHADEDLQRMLCLAKAESSNENGGSLLSNFSNVRMASDSEEVLSSSISSPSSSIGSAHPTTSSAPPLSSSSVTTLPPRSAAVNTGLPYYILEPSFVLLAGAAAAVAYQAVDYPLEIVRNIFYLKEAEKQQQTHRHQPTPAMTTTFSPLTSPTTNIKMTQAGSRSQQPSQHSASSSTYSQTWQECKIQASRVGGWRLFLFANFRSTAMRAIPAASIGFLMFELMKRQLDARMYESEDQEMEVYLNRMTMIRDAANKTRLL